MGTSNNDMKFQNVFDTFEGKVQEFLLATQMARMILKIDEVIKPNTAQGFM